MAAALISFGVGVAGPRRRLGVITDIGTLDKATADNVFPAKRPYSPYAGRNFPTRPLFGDTHLHTSFSFDAGAFGAASGRGTPTASPRARRSPPRSGQPAKLSRPLDFLVVADHSDNMGFFPDLLAGKPELLADPPGRKWYDMIQTGKGADAAIEIIIAFSQGNVPEGADVRSRHAPPTARPGRRPSRRRRRPTIPAASPPSSATSGPRTPAATTCTATSSSATTATRPARSSRSPPMKPLGSDNPRDLWKWMAAYEDKTGGDVLAIAHNGNLSQRPHVPDHRVVHRQADRPRVRRDAGEVGAALRGDADQGRRRDPPVPVAQRRVRQLRALGQGQSRPERAEEAGDAASTSTPARR